MLTKSDSVSHPAPQTMNLGTQPQGINEGKIGERLQSVCCYECGCGKSYLSFAAIYLHFRNKHNIKLSTKESESRCKGDFCNGIRKLVYSCISESIKNQNQDGHKNNLILKSTCNFDHQLGNQSHLQEKNLLKLKECFDKYLEVEEKAPKWVYRMLNQFFQRESKKGKEINLRCIPLFLNRIVLDFANLYNHSLELESTTWRRMCQELQKFSMWMKREGFTDLTVIYTEKEQRRGY